jgi:S-DNA-T family DNA segregation ATPase FtsK/SpoIIIE
MVLGKTITGESVVIDVAKTPHLLVAGTTGSGKSVCINGLICSVLFTKTPRDVRMILVDPKMVELSLYNGIPHLLTPVITDAKKALKAMNFVVEEMERRMAMFSSIGAKKIEEYNEKIVEKKLAREKLPYIMVIIDEFADLMLAVGKELETSIKRITAVARFCGIHLILATQRPSADVITGVIKSNIPTQIAFAVSNSMNSRIIIDQVGAEKLLGRGDMLYNNPESRQPSRIQGAFIDSEIEEIVSFVKTQGEPDYIDESYFEDDDEEEAEDPEAAASSASEDLFSRAWKIVSDRGEASASYIQRRLNIGYNRAANLIEQMEDAGYVGPARGSKPREILKLYGSD